MGTWFVSAWGQFVSGLIVIGFFTYVMYRGRLSGELEADAISQDTVLAHFFERRAA